MNSFTRIKEVLVKYSKFIGPGIMVSVAYMDPGNYSTSVSAGALYQYKLLFAIFMSNLFAVLLQVLCVKLGSVTGLDLAEMCRKSLPKKLNLSLYVLAEIAIVATDLAEVVGTAISLEILFGISLNYGVLLTILDVIFILFAYNKDGSMRQIRLFEMVVSALVGLTCLCFVLELFKIRVPRKWEVLEGFLPSKELLEEKALYISLGILGATVMPHSLYLGSALVQSRLKEFDLNNGLAQKVSRGEEEEEEEEDLDKKYKPSLKAIDYCLQYSYWELIISLFVIAVFVNSSILIVAGATLYKKSDAEDADLLSIYEMLKTYVSPAAGVIFALAMLFSGQSAGIVCTMSGQIVSEGFIKWSFKPWVRRVVTRLLAIIPCIFVTLTMGRKGIADILNGSQVVLSLILPFVSAPLIYFTSTKEYMWVDIADYSSIDVDSNTNTALTDEQSGLLTPNRKNFANGVLMTTLGLLVWGIISLLNLYLIYVFFTGGDVF